MNISPVSKLETLTIVPIVSDDSLTIFAKYFPNTPIENQSIKQIQFPSQAVDDLTHARQRLAKAQSQSTTDKILSVLSVSVVVGAVFASVFACILTGEPEIRLMVGSFGYFTTFFNGIIADQLSASTVSEDLGISIRGAINEHDYAALVTLPFYPFIAAKRMFQRVSNLEKRVKFLEEQTNRNHTMLTNYFTLYSETIKEKINEEKSCLREDLNRMNGFHSAFSNQKKQLEQDIRRLNTAIDDLEEISIFYKNFNQLSNSWFSKSS